MLGKLLQRPIPGGASLLEAIGYGLFAGRDPLVSLSQIPNNPRPVINIEVDGSQSVPTANVIVAPPARPELVLDQSVTLRLGLQRAQMLPNALKAASLQAGPMAYSLYQPIRQVAEAVQGFRGPTALPPVTGLEGEQTLLELVADALAGAKVPVGFPVPPPLDPISAAVGLAAATTGGWLADQLTQLWGLFAGRPLTSGPYVPPPGTATITGTVPPAGNTAGGTLTVTRLSGNIGVSRLVSGSCVQDPLSNPGQRVVVNNNVTAVEFIQEQGTCGVKRIAWRITNTFGFQSTIDDIGSTDGHWKLPDYTVSWSGPNAQQYPPNTEVPLPDGYQPPAPEVSNEAALPATPTLPLPVQLEPGNTGGEGTTETETGNSPSPRTWNVYSPVVEPPKTNAFQGQPGTAAAGFPQPDLTNLTNAGTLPLPALLPPAITDPAKVFYGTAGFNGTGAAPAATLQGIATELGRIEQKLGSMLDPTPDTGSELWNLLRQLLEALFNAADSGTYLMNGVCEVDEENNLLEPQPEYQYEWGGSFFALANIGSRLDAIAQMLQKHKELRQPTCVRPKPQGQPVQVNFIQSELEWEPPP